MSSNPSMPSTIEGYGAALRRGEVSAEKMTREYLRRIAAHNDKLGAYAHFALDQTLAAARAIPFASSAKASLPSAP